MGGDVDDDEAETMQVMQGWGVAAGDESLTQHFHGDGEGHHVARVSSAGPAAARHEASGCLG